MKTKFIATLLLAGSVSGAAQASTSAFANNPAGNSSDWANQIASIGGVVNTAIDFETHPLGALIPDHYASIGVNMALSGSSFSFNEVYNYQNNYSGTVSGYGPNSSAEGIAAETRSYSAFNPAGAWSLTLNFDQPVLGAGLFVIDLFNGLGDRTVTLSAFDGTNGGGSLLATASAPTYNYQLYNQLFLGVANNSASANIRSVVFTNPYPYYGDGIAVDNIRFATAAPVPEPESYALMLAGLGLIGALARRRS